MYQILIFCGFFVLLFAIIAIIGACLPLIDEYFNSAHIKIFLAILLLILSIGYILSITKLYFYLSRL